jgi:zinc and cadmium transporter
MSTLPSIIMATFTVSLFSLSGIYALSLSEKTLHRILFIIISFSAGSIMGTVFFDLLPEAIELVNGEFVYIYVAFGFVLFFFLERFIYWYHGHGHGHEDEIKRKPSLIGGGKPRSFVYLNLIGDAVHNFIDGLVIASSFLVNQTLGIATTVAIILHELPQEMGDYGILIYGGVDRRKALFINFLVALTVVLGGITAVFLIGSVEVVNGFLIALAAGGFTYLGASELIPEIQNEKNAGRSAIQFASLLLGMILIWSLGLIFPE